MIDVRASKGFRVLGFQKKMGLCFFFFFCCGVFI